VGLSGSVDSIVGEKALQGGTIGGESAASDGGVFVPFWMSGKRVG
jgi:hypothetical protein